MPLIGKANNRSYEVDERTDGGRSTVRALWDESVDAGKNVSRIFEFEQADIRGLRSIQAHVTTANPQFYDVSVTGWDYVDGIVKINYTFSNHGPSAFRPRIHFFIWYS